MSTTLLLGVAACGVESKAPQQQRAPVTTAAQILLVAGSPRGAPPDRDVVQHLQARGHTVDIVADDALRAADVAGRDLVLVASSVVPSDVGTKLRDVTVPVVLWEQFLYDEMQMASAPRVTPGNTRNVVIEAPGHPAAGGLTGSVAITDGSTRLTYATPAGSAQTIASVQGRAHTFVYVAGETMRNGFVAPAIRAGIGFDYPTPAALNTNGWSLFDGVVDFALGGSTGGGGGGGGGDGGGGGAMPPPGAILDGDEPLPNFPASPLPTTYFQIPWNDYPPVWKNTGNPASRIGWINRCTPSARAQIDPIVSPMSPTSGHLHDFFSNPAVRHDRVFTHQLVGGVSRSTLTCDDNDDFAAYWVAAVHDNGQSWVPEALHVYYKGKVRANHIQPIPLGLRMVVGDAGATSNQSAQVGWWERMRNSNEGNTGALPPNTRNLNQMITVGGNEQLVLRLNYPDCWDGQYLYKPDGSHMAYSRGAYGSATCPASHPVAIPQVVYFVRYPPGVDGGSDFTLSSGNWYTFHGDFWNAWDPRVMQQLVDRCVRSKANCRLSRSVGDIGARQRRITIGN
ncbi:MAG: DUF1996 domain-containing protein [Deltaproteobacteria bacterium]|jgi:hypothetical protein